MRAKRITWFRKRIDFLRLSQMQSRFRMPTLILQISSVLQHDNAYIGLTVSRQTGHAVRRNRIRRRLRSMLEEVFLLKKEYELHSDLVIIGLAEAFDYPYVVLCTEFKTILRLYESTKHSPKGF